MADPFHLDAFEWIATAVANTDTVVRWVLVTNGVGIGTDGVRLHGALGIGLADGLYDPQTRARVVDRTPFPNVERLRRAALDAQQIADWSAYGALVGLQSVAPDALLQLFSHAGPIHCSPTLLRDALAGFASPTVDTRVAVFSDGPTRPLGLECDRRFAILMPVIPTPDKFLRIVEFLPAGAR